MSVSLVPHFLLAWSFAHWHSACLMNNSFIIIVSCMQYVNFCILYMLYTSKEDQDEDSNEGFQIYLLVSVDTSY